MKIEQVRVLNYKSILDSGWVDIEDGVTTLVGATEAGRMNPPDGCFEVQDEGRHSNSDICRYQDTIDVDKTDILVVSLRICEYQNDRF